MLRLSCFDTCCVQNVMNSDLVHVQLADVAEDNLSSTAIWYVLYQLHTYIHTYTALFESNVNMSVFWKSCG